MGGGVRGEYYKTSYILNLLSLPLFGSTNFILIAIPPLSQVQCLWIPISWLTITAHTLKYLSKFPLSPPASLPFISSHQIQQFLNTILLQQRYAGIPLAHWHSNFTLGLFTGPEVSEHGLLPRAIRNTTDSNDSWEKLKCVIMKTPFQAWSKGQNSFYE
jgi:hypothetical protein